MGGVLKCNPDESGAEDIFPFNTGWFCDKNFRMADPNREIKAKIPLRVILTSVLIGLFIAGFLLLAIWQSGHSLRAARMPGTIIAKEFQPLAQPEREITLNRGGTVSARNTDGQYLITVEVLQPDGSKKSFTVWLNDKQRYDAVKVGDSFDVGPYLVR